MHLLKPSVKLISYTPNIMETLERAGRVCYQSEEAHEVSVKRLIEESIVGVSEKYANQVVSREFVGSIVKRGHLSVVEHVSATAHFICDRGVTHELVRHRLAAYSQESTRYVNYGKRGGCQFIIPPWSGLEEGEYTVNPTGDLVEAYPVGKDSKWYDSQDHDMKWWLTSMGAAEQSYISLLGLNWTPQKARSVLPNSTKTAITMSANMREWMHVFNLRTSKRAHPQIREITMPLLALFREKWPVLFNEVGIVDDGVSPCKEDLS